jgi:hypothetical protein
MTSKIFWREVKCFFKYDLNFYKVQDFFYNLKWFFRNLKNFRKQLWDFRSWDHSHAIDMYICCLEQVANSIENGHEEERSATKKVVKIRELIELLRYSNERLDDELFDLYDKLRAEGKTNNEIAAESYKFYFEFYEKIFTILRGQDHSVICRTCDAILEEKYGSKEYPHEEWYDEYVKLFDGSGANDWWD